MDILVIEISRAPTGTYLSLSSGKTDMFIGVAKTHVTTLVKNASHATWRGSGKTFHGADMFDKALAAYKSPECKAMIEYARTESAKPAA
jgi:hypothetical protein